jgi:hypothetical protein
MSLPPSLGAQRDAATGCAPVILSEQGADFISEEVSGAEGE